MTGPIQESSYTEFKQAYIEGVREAGKRWPIKAAVFIIAAAIWCNLTHTPGEDLVHWLSGGWFGSFIPRWALFMFMWIAW